MNGTLVTAVSINITITAFLAFAVFDVGTRTSSLELQQRLSAVDAQQATERSIRAERAAQTAKETLDAVQFSVSTRR